MSERIEITPKKDFLLHYYSDFYHEVASRLGHRLMYDTLQIPINNLPIGGDKGVNKIVNFLPEISRSYEKDTFYSQLLSEYNPKYSEAAKDNIFSDYINEYLNKINLDKDSNKNMLTNHAILTLSYLASKRRVNYKSLEYDDDKLNFSDDDSVWLENLTPEEICSTLNELQDSTHKMICTTRGTAYQKELRAAHFFAAGYKLIRRILPKERYIKIEKEHFFKN